jgi:polysaccharide biosynthesis transport protein
VDLASPPEHPFTPDIPRNLAMAFVLGLTSGVALAFVLEAMDNTVCTPEQAEAIAALPSLAVIPFENGLLNHAKNGRRLLASGRQNEDKVVGLDAIAYTSPNSGMAEAHRALRTAILLSSPDAAPKVIVVTSPLPQEGKTTTCINCAIVLAQEGRRVLLVDADLRRPSIHGRLGINAARGLTTVLTGNAAPESAFIPSPQLRNLWVLPAGPISLNPSELLGSSQMKHLLAEWGAMFDHVVLDLPPVLPVTDAVRISPEAHAVVLVVRAGHTSKGALRRTVALLAQVNANVLGIVVNALDLKSSDQYYYAGSEYSGYSEADQTEKASA